MITVMCSSCRNTKLYLRGGMMYCPNCGHRELWQVQFVDNCRDNPESLKKEERFHVARQSV